MLKTWVLETWDGTKAKEKNMSKLDLRIDLGNNESDYTAASTHAVTVLR